MSSDSENRQASANDDVVTRWGDLAFEIYCEGYDGDVPPHYPFSVGDRAQRLCEKIEAAFKREIENLKCHSPNEVSFVSCSYICTSQPARTDDD